LRLFFRFFFIFRVVFLLSYMFTKNLNYPRVILRRFALRLIGQFMKVYAFGSLRVCVCVTTRKA